MNSYTPYRIFVWFTCAFLKTVAKSIKTHCMNITCAVAANTTKPNSLSAQADWKYNAVLYGTPECLKGTKNYDWPKQDLINVISVLFHMLTVKSLHKIYVTVSVWGNTRNLLNDHLIQLTRAIDLTSLLSLIIVFFPTTSWLNQTCWKPNALLSHYFWKKGGISSKLVLIINLLN